MKKIAFALTCLVVFLIVAERSCFAQAGSTGGTLGKTDKSVSGGEDKGEPRSTRSDKSALPQRIQLTVNGFGGPWSCNLHHIGGKTYEGSWNVAIVSRMTVTMSLDTVTIQRQDTSNANGPLYSDTYSGARTGNSASGTSSHYGQSWAAAW